LKEWVLQTPTCGDASDERPAPDGPGTDLRVTPKIHPRHPTRETGWGDCTTDSEAEIWMTRQRQGEPPVTDKVY